MQTNHSTAQYQKGKKDCLLWSEYDIFFALLILNSRDVCRGVERQNWGSPHGAWKSYPLAALAAKNPPFPMVVNLFLRAKFPATLACQRGYLRNCLLRWRHGGLYGPFFAKGNIKTTNSDPLSRVPILYLAHSERRKYSDTTWTALLHIIKRAKKMAIYEVN